MQRRTFISASGAAAATLAAPSLWAQVLPTNPIRIIVGFAPGGGTDILARVIGQKLGEMWKTQVIVENKAGASGTIAADYVAKQPGDGTTLLMAHINSQAITPALQKVNYDAAKDFQPVVLVGVTPNLLICNENQPAKTSRTWLSCAAPTPARSASARPAPAAPSTWRWRCSCWPPMSRPSTCRTRARAPCSPT
jgi:tripartite-type tricarboxylate transporter receptor subunit TctC